MTYQQYQKLGEESQEQVFLEQGVQIAEREEPGYIFHLYQVGSFYLELTYNTRLDSLQSFRSFESTDKLEPYLQLIRLSWLVK